MKKILTAIAILAFLAFLIQETNALPNPWVECKDDIKCGADVAGFNFPLRVENYSVRAMKDMLEITFPFKNRKSQTVIIRKSQIADDIPQINGLKDISGVYDNFPLNKDVRIRNSVIFNIRGTKSRFYVANFGAESGYYSIYSKKGIKIKELEYFYKLLEEAEAPRHDYDKEPLTIEQLMDLRRVDEIVEPVYTQDCFPRTLEKRGVTKDCFERANLGDDSYCHASEIKMIKEYYKKGQDKDPLNNANIGNSRFCADE